MHATADFKSRMLRFRHVLHNMMNSQKKEKLVISHPTNFRKGSATDFLPPETHSIYDALTNQANNKPDYCFDHPPSLTTTGRSTPATLSLASSRTSSPASSVRRPLRETSIDRDYRGDKNPRRANRFREKSPMSFHPVVLASSQEHHPVGLSPSSSAVSLRQQREH